MLQRLRTRFPENRNRHPELSRELVENRRRENETALAALSGILR